MKTTINLSTASAGRFFLQLGTSCRPSSSNAHLLSPPVSRSLTYIFRRRALSERISILVARRTSTSRFFSTCHSSSWLQQRIQTTDADSFLGESTLEAPAPELTARDSKLTCAYFDKNGSLVAEHKELSKAKIAEQFELRHRDLRDIDLRSESVTRILIRPATILLQFFDLCLIIQTDEALLINLRNSSSSPSSSSPNERNDDFERRMSAKEPADLPELPYELRAVEAALMAVLSTLRQDLVQAKQDAEHSARHLRLESGFAAVGLDLLFEHSRTLGKIEQKARLVRDTIREVLDTDEDLAGMYLSDRKAGKPHQVTDHQEAEYMLEAYHTAADALVESAGGAIDVMRKKENTFRSSLDVQRNQIMFLNAKIGIHTLGLAGGTLIAGLFGMNLVNYLEEAPYGFFVITVYGMRNIYRIQSLKDIKGQMAPRSQPRN
ncbi:magnesium ion transporter [Exophiala xenobiotica]|uniref:Magnesium transporter n=1 Tax=Vermiconidia calcicola TaxID=1690605 RepID=A0AAV9QIF6_9PEZI|nr:magnesium ion transporter [Exophiala xenobiotica]KAK5541947.1 magnesium ion transporter [Vermiconidia calcicola]KAK5543062.1 magnesium ion transporter [Chaetothyriales sp. CCFEE 6169]KAK5341000.1 magnesium ion transporter [Exophiala xenobiotica]KAK5433715.1 magnesium ion transporter [Exophiala xenobiotica]